jgi:hypothetical protein
LLVRQFTTEESKAATPTNPATQTPPSEVRILAQGAGWTPEEARQQALRTAIRTTLSTMVAPETWAGEGERLTQAILSDSAGLVLSAQDLKASEGCQMGRKVYFRTLAVSLARPALAERLTRVAAR